MAKKFQYFVLTEVTSKNIIVIILENIYTDITSKWYVNFSIKIKKTDRVYRPLAIYKNVFCSGPFTRKSQTNVLV